MKIQIIILAWKPKENNPPIQRSEKEYALENNIKRNLSNFPEVQEEI